MPVCVPVMGKTGLVNTESGDLERQKQSAAQAAARLVEDGMTVGLGTGSTVAYLLPALASRHLSIRCVATSIDTRRKAIGLGLTVDKVDSLDVLDIAIDGADQVTPDGWLIKGAGGAHTREKIVAASAARFIVIADSTKPVEALRPPVPVELLSFGLPATLRHLGQVKIRAGVPPSPDGGVIADYLGPIDDPARVAAWLSAIPGVAGHGIFEPAITSDVLIGWDDSVEHRVLGG